MFCFQCEQTAGGKGCMGKAGVCGKRAETADHQDGLVGALIALAQAAEKNPSAVSETTHQLILDGLFTTVTNVSFNDDTIQVIIDRTRAEKAQLGGAEIPDYDMQKVWNGDEGHSLVEIADPLRYQGHGGVCLSRACSRLYRRRHAAIFLQSPRCIGNDEFGMDELLPIVLEVGEVNLTCMALLDRANTETYGTPEPTEVTLTVEKGPFIVVTGHDLYDLKQLLEQTKDKGVNIYTHGEMLPAHAYPELKKYPHLKGNFGTAWQNQQKEFDGIPAPILYTTNCLMPTRGSYSDRVFTTEVVSYPDAVHIGDDKDFTPVIEKALALGGYCRGSAFHRHQRRWTA